MHHAYGLRSPTSLSPQAGRGLSLGLWHILRIQFRRLLRLSATFYVVYSKITRAFGLSDLVSAIIYHRTTHYVQVRIQQNFPSNYLIGEIACEEYQKCSIRGGQRVTLQRSNVPTSFVRTSTAG